MQSVFAMWILHAMAWLATHWMSVADGAAVEGRSDGETFVALMKPADLRNRDHLAAVRRLDGASIRAVFVERQMGPRAVIVIDCSPSAQVGQFEAIEEERVFGSS